MSRRVVSLGGQATYAAIVFNALKRDYPGLTVVRDGPISRVGLAWRRIPKQGVFSG
jgi:hypothetical protein